MTVADKVENAEILYRSVPNQLPQYYSVIHGRLLLSASAFNDRPARKPSVDRAERCNSDPAHTQKKVTDGVVSLVTFSVRQTADVIREDERGQPKLQYKIDVIPAPIIRPPIPAG